jgi:hypothetical protein
MSFDLKPQNEISLSTIPDQMIWSAPRSHVPPLLADRVSLSQWQLTFDSVLAQYQRILEGITSLRPWIFIPCCACFIFPKMIELKRETNEEWLRLVAQQQEIYRSAGVQVSLVKEIFTMGAGSSRNLQKDVVGLRFEIAPLPAGSPSLSPTNVGRGGVVEQLERLTELHKSGALSQIEYEQAKAKVLQ